MRLRTSATVVAAAALLVAGPATGVASATPAEAGAGPLAVQSLPPGGGRLFDSVALDDHTLWAGGLRATPSADGRTADETPLLLSRDDRDGRGWQEVPLPPASGADNGQGDNEINSIAPVPGSRGHEAWVVGLADLSMGDGLPGHGAPGPILADHWNGSTWQSLPVPLPAGSEFGGLTTVSAVASDDVWAVGWAQILDSYTPNPDKPGGGWIEDHMEALAVHWDGHAWTRVTMPDERSFLPNTMTALGPDDVWVAGYDSQNDVPQIRHWDGRAWTAEALPATGLAGEVYQIGADASGALWAVGRTVLTDTDTGHALVLRRTGGRWQQVRMPDWAGQLNSFAVTPRGITAAGNDPRTGTGYAIRLDGAGRQRLPLPATDGPVLLGGVSYSARQGLVLVGDTEPAGDPGAPTPLVIAGP